MDITLERILTLIPRKPNGDFVHGAKKDFAESLGLKGGNIVTDWIGGRCNSYMGKLFEISEKYNVSVEWLRGETDIKEKAPANTEGLSDEEWELIKAYRKAPAHLRAIVDTALAPYREEGALSTSEAM